MANFKAIVFKDGYTLADGTVLEAFVASLLNCNIATSASNINELTKRLKAVIIEEYEYITYQNMEPLGNSVPAKYFSAIKYGSPIGEIYIPDYDIFVELFYVEGKYL